MNIINHTYSHTHIHIHTYTHTHTHIYIYIYIYIICDFHTSVLPFHVVYIYCCNILPFFSCKIFSTSSLAFLTFISASCVNCKINNIHILFKQILNCVEYPELLSELNVIYNIQDEFCKEHSGLIVADGAEHLEKQLSVKMNLKSFVKIRNNCYSIKQK